MERKRRYVNTDIGTVEHWLRQYVCEKETRRWSGDTNGPGRAHLIAANGHLWVYHSDPDGEFSLQLQKRNPGEGWQPLTRPLTLTARRTEAQRVQVTLDYEEEGAKEANALWAEMQSLWPEVRPQLAQLGIPLAGEGLSGQGARVEPEKRPSWFPKTGKTKKLWQTRWKLMCELDVAARAGYQAGNRENLGPSGKWSEYIRHLATNDGTDKVLGVRIVRYIKKAGENGWLT